MTSHDPAIQRISARKNHCCYGMGLGIIILDDVYPGFPGDVRNASAHPFPIQYEIAEGVDIKKLVRGHEKGDLLEPVLAAARKLERMGCRAIAAECGYFAWFQQEIARVVNVPVFASSLLQVPMAQTSSAGSRLSVFCSEMRAIASTIGSNTRCKELRHQRLDYSRDRIVVCGRVRSCRGTIQRSKESDRSWSVRAHRADPNGQKRCSVVDVHYIGCSTVILYRSIVLSPFDLQPRIPRAWLEPNHLLTCMVAITYAHPSRNHPHRAARAAFGAARHRPARRGAARARPGRLAC